MKTTKKLLLGSAAALTVSLATYGQTTDSTLGTRDSELKGTAQTDHYSTKHLGTDSVGKLNRASSLIGMDVRNAENVKLGDIQDVVVDWQSGKIGYVVLSVGGFLGIGEKYIAIPHNAFVTGAGAQQDHLVLHADKAKIQNAPSFTKDNWPQFGATGANTYHSYWQTDASAVGTSGATSSGIGTGSSDLNRQGDLNRGTDLNRKNDLRQESDVNRSDLNQPQSGSDLDKKTQPDAP